MVNIVTLYYIIMESQLLISRVTLGLSSKFLSGGGGGLKTIAQAKLVGEGGLGGMLENLDLIPLK